MFCPEHDKNNPYWHKLEVLLYEQGELMSKIRKFNDNLMGRSASKVTIFEFLNEASPTKPPTTKRKAEVYDITDTCSGDVNNNEELGDDISTSNKRSRGTVSL